MLIAPRVVPHEFAQQSHCDPSSEWRIAPSSPTPWGYGQGSSVRLRWCPSPAGPADIPSLRSPGRPRGRGAGRRIGRRSLSPHESDRGARSRGWRGSCRSPTAGIGKEGTGRCAGPVTGVLEAVGPEREAAGVRKTGREGRMIPGIRRNGAEVSRTVGPARIFGRRPSGRSEDLRPRRRRGRLGDCPHMRVRGIFPAGRPWARPAAFRSP